MPLEQTSLFDFGFAEEEKKPEIKAAKPVAEKKPAPKPVVMHPVTEEPKAAESGEEPLNIKSKRGRKSLKDIELTTQYVNVPEDEILFQKQYYSITEVSQMFNVNPSLLRFWEAEFPVQLRLRKNRKGDRFFRPEDIKTVQQLWFLLREKKLTIEGARAYFRKNKKNDDRFALIQSLQSMRTFLTEMKASL